MSPGKLAAQVSHGSMAFLSTMVRNSTKILETQRDGEVLVVELPIPVEMYMEWFEGSFTKVILEAKSKNKLLRAIDIAKELGFEEGKDYFPIYDSCRTELEPEEENGTTLTVVGFRPLDSETADKIGKKFQLWRDSRD